MTEYTESPLPYCILSFVYGILLLIAIYLNLGSIPFNVLIPPLIFSIGLILIGGGYMLMCFIIVKWGK